MLTYSIQDVIVERDNIFVIISCSDGSETKLMFSPDDFTGVTNAVQAVKDKINAYLVNREKFNKVATLLKTKIGGTI